MSIRAPEGILVAVAHGSADPRAAATITDLMTVVAGRAARRGADIPDLHVAYLGHVPPSLPEVTSEAVAMPRSSSVRFIAMARPPDWATPRLSYASTATPLSTSIRWKKVFSLM